MRLKVNLLVFLVEFFPYTGKEVFIKGFPPLHIENQK